MNTPKRIQRKRTAGWRMPEGAVYVGRPSRWGNPFACYPAIEDGLTRREVHLDRVTLYRRWLAGERWLTGEYGNPPTTQEIQRALRGRDLCCWCPLSLPCHADVLLEIANAPEEAPDAPTD